MIKFCTIIYLLQGRVQEMRGLHLDLREEVAAVQWRDQFGDYDYVQRNDLSWQPTDLKLINDYGVPNPELMYPHFVTKCKRERSQEFIGVCGHSN
uniref:Uncharacterized protein n=1 Tax=Globodera rostochiensis TaxID=31243 RepID=A0A914IAP8_GLORO